ncbi:MAG: hypothetical protein IPN05_14845 [Sulfuritalea sp.]|nr:hypothetical protein [Sulfuritalea sp.]
MGSSPSPSSGERFGRWRWLWVLPRLVSSCSSEEWRSCLDFERADQDERRATLISDILWLEQKPALSFDP